MAYTYRDILKQPLSAAELTALAALDGRTPKEIVNLRSSGFKELRTEVASDSHALEIMTGNPRIMIRPVLASTQRAVFGFDEAAFQKLAE